MWMGRSKDGLALMNRFAASLRDARVWGAAIPGFRRASLWAIFVPSLREDRTLLPCRPVKTDYSRCFPPGRQAALASSSRYRRDTRYS